MGNFLAVWGSNENNQLNVPFKYSKIPGASIQLVSGSLNVIKGSVGYNHAVIFAEKPPGYTQNILTGWGNNDFGQIYFADKNYYYMDCEAGIKTTYLLDLMGRIHGFGRDLSYSDVGKETGIILNWDFYYDENKTWPQGYGFYPSGFVKLSAGSGYLLAITNSGKITGWGSESEIITGQTSAHLRSGIALSFNQKLNSGSYVTINLTGNSWTGFRAIWQQSQNNTLFYDLNLYNNKNNNLYTSGLSVVDGGLGSAIYSGYLDIDKSYLRVILTGTGTPSGFGILGVMITGFYGKNWGNELKVINPNIFNTINSIGVVSSVSAGYNHAIVLFSGTSGLITGWGDNSFGQLNIDTNYISGAKISAGARDCYAIGLKNPIINNITGDNPLGIFYQGTGTGVTGLLVQRKSGNSNIWESPTEYLRYGTAITNGLNHLIGIVPTGNTTDNYYYRLIELLNNNRTRTGAAVYYNRDLVEFISEDYILYNWGGSGITTSENIKFFPSLGNYDYDGPSASGQEYLENFTQLNKLKNNTSNSKKYYEVIIGDCHFFILDSDPVTGGDYRDGDPLAGAGIGDPNSPNDNYLYSETQKTWFNERIINSRSKWKFVIFHHPPYTSDILQYGNWNLSYTYGWNLDYADVVFNGHAHNYERFIKDHGRSDFTYYIVNGAGGFNLGTFGTPLSNSVYREAEKYGFTKLRVYENAIVTSFVDINLQESDIVIIPSSETPINLINTFAIIADYGVNGSSDITTMPLDFYNPDTNFYTYKVGQAISKSRVDAIFTAGNNSYPWGENIYYPNNVNLTYSNYFTGSVFPKNEISFIPTGIENINVLDIDAGYKTNMILTPTRLSTGTAPLVFPEPIIEPGIPAPCSNIIYDV